MTPPETVIDEIVRRVMQQLSGEEEPPCSTDGELVLHDPVITAGLLDERLKDARRLVVAPAAVITPAARDLLNQQQVQVHTQDRPRPKGGRQVTVGLSGTRLAPASLEDYLDRAKVTAQFVEACDLPGAVEQLVQGIETEQALAVLLTEQAAAALCLANRCRHVRAIQAADLPSLRQAAPQVGANLLTIDPRGLSHVQLVRLITEFVNAGPYACPETFSSLTKP